MKSFISASFVAVMLSLTRNARAQVAANSLVSPSESWDPPTATNVPSDASNSWEVTATASPSSYVLCPEGWYTRPPVPTNTPCTDEPAGSASESSWIPVPSNEPGTGGPAVTASSYISGDVHTIIWGDSGYVYGGHTYSSPPQVFPTFDVEGGTSVPVITVTATEGPIVTAPSYESGDIYTIILNDGGYVYEGTTYSRPPQVFPTWDEQGGTKVPVITVTNTGPSVPSGVGSGSDAPAPSDVGSGSGANVPAPSGVGSGTDVPAPSGVGSGSGANVPAPSSAGTPAECFPAGSFPVPSGSYSVDSVPTFGADPEAPTFGADPEAPTFGAEPTQGSALGQTKGNENAAVSARSVKSAAAVLVGGVVGALML